MPGTTGNTAPCYAKLFAMPPVPIDIAIGFTLLSVGVLTTFSVLLLNISRSLRWVVAAMVGWTILTAVLALSGTLAGFTSRPPWVPILVLAELAFVVWLAWFSSWRDLLTQIPQFILVGFQCFRVPVELLLAMLGSTGLLAIEMTYYGRNFDIVVGVTAVILAVWLHWDGERSLRPIILGWNVMGLCLLTIVLAHGILSVPYPFQLLHLSVPTFVVAHFPIVWLVTVLVPIAYFLHLLSIRRCLTRELDTV